MSFKASQSVSAKSKYGYFKVFYSREEGVRGYLNEKQIFTDLDDFRVSEPLIIPGLVSGKTENVLIIGGSDGLVASKLVSCFDCKSVDVVWDDDSLAEICKQIPEINMLNNSAHYDHRIDFWFEDVVLYLEKTSKVYDLILIDVFLPESAALNFFYSVDFFQQLKKVMNKGSRIAIKSSMVLNYYNSVGSSLNKVFKYIKKYCVNAVAIKNIGFFIASDKKIKFDTNKIPKELDFLNKEYFESLFIFTKDKKFFLEEDKENMADDVYLPFSNMLYKYVDPENLLVSNYANFVYREHVSIDRSVDFENFLDVFLYRNNLLFEMKSIDSKLLDLIDKKGLQKYKEIYVYSFNVNNSVKVEITQFVNIVTKEIYQNDDILSVLYGNVEIDAPRWLAEHDVAVLMIDDLLKKSNKYFWDKSSNDFLKVSTEEGILIIDYWTQEYSLNKEKKLMDFIKFYSIKNSISRVFVRSHGISLSNLSKQVPEHLRFQYLGERNIFSKCKKIKI